MPKSSSNKQVLNELNTQLSKLKGELQSAKKTAGIDEYLNVTIKANQARFERIHTPGSKDKGVGEFYIELEITAKQTDLYIPISIASGKKTTGFMYRIEGTGTGQIDSASASWRGDAVTEVTLGTLFYAKIPASKTGTFIIKSTIRGNIRKTYTIVISRINYKLNLNDGRYRQYTKEITSDRIIFQ